jgi:hypothetical protein
MQSQYIIKPALADEALEQWVWVWVKDSNEDCKHIDIKYGKNKINVYMLIIDNNFKRRYQSRTGYRIPDKDNVLIISNYYRGKLGIKVNETVSLDIKEASKLIRLPKWNCPHPTVEAANRASIISIALGIISLLVTFKEEIGRFCIGICRIIIKIISLLCNC